MNLEKEIFKRGVFNNSKLLNYGFIIEDGIFIFKKKIDINLEAIIKIENDVLTGQIYDLDVDEEYTNFRVLNQNGNFVGMIREKYINLLKDIKEECFEDTFFISNQANRISGQIYKKYNCKPIFKFDDNPDYGVFENNSKWFGLIMNIDKSKLKIGSGQIEIINIKLDKNKIISLLKNAEYYEAYHMNKKNWISIILDDTLSDDKILSLIDESYSNTIISKKSINEWVMPINQKYFDVFDYFDSSDIFYFDKKRSFKEKDIIYLYVTKPIGAIMYKCIVDDISSDFMIVKKICKYNGGEYSLDILKKYGLSSIRSTRHIPLKLSEYINKKDN